MVTNLLNRQVGEHFQRSGDTISKCFNRIVDAITSPAFYNTFIRLLEASQRVEQYIADNPKFYPFFKDALGALDGTHISTRPGEDVRRHILTVAYMLLIEEHKPPEWVIGGII
ncbi:hypothetical protein K439DRAFT_1330968 [Ramaria rubella]|nr:hypothetical protein K439DRAFT_1330968 [Ramaria rubella]